MGGPRSTANARSLMTLVDLLSRLTAAQVAEVEINISSFNHFVLLLTNVPFVVSSVPCCIQGTLTFTLVILNYSHAAPVCCISCSSKAFFYFMTEMCSSSCLV